MNKNGPIIIIEDDEDDRDLIQMVYKAQDHKNELIFIENGEQAIKYLSEMKEVPFIIISDLNMPKINGIELRMRVQQNEMINIKCIPYIMLSTTASKNFVNDAYLLGVQGYFKKPSVPQELGDIFRTIIDYWKISYAPGMYMVE